MKYIDFPICNAIYDVYTEMELKGKRPRCIDYFIYDEQREWLAKEIYNALPAKEKKLITCDIERFLKLWDNFGKSANNKTGASSKLIIEVARMHGCKCYYEGRVSSPCTDIMTVDRILPGDRGGEYIVANCQIACSRHNSSRNDKIIESVVNGRRAI